MKQIPERIMESLRLALGLNENDTSKDEEIRNYPPHYMFHQWFNYVFDIDDTGTLDCSDVRVLHAVEDIWGIYLSGAVCDKCGNALPREEQGMSRCSDCRNR